MSDRVSSRAKTLHPVYVPLVAPSFELYGSGQYSFRSLCAELIREGLVNRLGRHLSPSNFSDTLRNPIYAGTIRLRGTGEVYPGVHRPLVTRALFDQVQGLLTSRRPGTRRVRHAFAFQRFIRCTCGRHLIGERIENRDTYYRCHECRGVCVREEKVDAVVTASLPMARDYRSRSERAHGAATAITFDGHTIGVGAAVCHARN